MSGFPSREGQGARGRRAWWRYGPADLLVNAACALAILSIAAVTPAHAAEPLRLLVVGDSLTAGWGLPRPEAFPARLQAALRAEGLSVTVIDAGVSGDTTAGGLARLPWVLGDAAHRPDAAIVQLGGNDLLRGLAPAATSANLEAILRRLNERGVPVLLAGMRAPPNLGADYTGEFDAVYPRVARQHGAMLYPFFLDGVAGVPALNQPDGIHPNAAGVAVIVERIGPYVRDLLKMAGIPSAKAG